jgi:transposase
MSSQATVQSVLGSHETFRHVTHKSRYIPVFNPNYSSLPIPHAIMPTLPKTSRREHSGQVLNLVFRMHDQKYSGPQIANALDLPRSTVYRVIKDRERHQERIQTGSKRPGRKPKLSRRAERALIRHVNQNPKDTLQALSSPSKSGHQLHINTVRKYLAKNELHCFKPRRKPFLSAKHMQDRLKWAKEHLNWTLSDWRCAIFSDESTFELGSHTLTTYVKRKKGQAFKPQYLQPTFKSGRTKVNVWGCIDYTNKGKLVILPPKTNMNSELYCNTILNDHGHPMYQKVMEKRGDAIWQDDGAKYHTSKMVKEWQKSMLMTRMWWPAQSPDLNPIENIWHIIKIAICKRRHRIESADELAEIILKEWEEMDIKIIQKVICSMRKRCWAVIAEKGGHTKY